MVRTCGSGMKIVQDGEGVVFCKGSDRMGSDGF